MTIQINDINDQDFQELDYDQLENIVGGFTHSPAYNGVSGAIVADSWSAAFQRASMQGFVNHTPTSGGWW